MSYPFRIIRGYYLAWRIRGCAKGQHKDGLPARLIKPSLCVDYAELSQPDNRRSCQLNISENDRLNLNSLLHNRSDGTQVTVDVLQIIVQRLILDADGTIVDFELNSPFAYLYQLMKGQCSSDDRSNSSKFVALGAPRKLHQLR